MTKGQRLDLKLMELGLFPSREAARAAIMDGGIIVDGEKLTKAGALVGEEAKIEISSHWQPKKYVSRGGLKLEKALAEFHIDCRGRVALDIGASTGGFTDCLLQNQAAMVYAVDVGYGQLAWSLRTDARVVIRERINARTLTPLVLYEAGNPWATLAVMDVSFISLTKVLPGVISVLEPSAYELVCLIKPQFEAGKSQVGKGGVVRSPDLHKQIIADVLKSAKELALSPLNLTFSPLKGPAGNIEYLVHLASRAAQSTANINQNGAPQSAANMKQNATAQSAPDVNLVVDTAFIELNA